MSEQSELIKKQIEEAAEHFAAMVEAHKQGHMNTWGKAIEGCCGNLLQVVKNQQQRIEECRRALALDAEPLDVCVCDHSTAMHGVRTGCKVLGCPCRQFRLEAK